MNRLRLINHGFWAGDFVVTTENCSFSIGDYIEVILKEEPYPTGEIVDGLRGQKSPIVAFPLVITVSAHIDEIEVELHRVLGIATRHYFDCLEINETSIVTSHKYQNKKLTWYMPKINGYTPSLF